MTNWHDKFLLPYEHNYDTIIDKHEVPSQNHLVMGRVTHVSYKECKVSLFFQCGILTMSSQDSASLGSPFLD